MTTLAGTQISAFSDKDDDALYNLLGNYSEAFANDPTNFESALADIERDVQTAGPLDDTILLGKRIVNRWNKALHEVVCGESGDDVVKNKIRSALGSKEALAVAITGMLISAFSVAPAVAAIVGLLLGRILLPQAGEEICAFWKEKLPA